MLVRGFAGALLALLLGACAGLADRPAADAVRLPAADFALDGRLSVRDGERSGTVALQWTRQGELDQIDFVTPTGQIVARLTAGPQSALLEMPNGERRSAASADALAEQALGLRVPVTRLADWVQAVPGPAARVLRRDAQGRPGLVSEEGWLVEYLSYAEDSPASAVRRIEAQWGEVRVNLLIDVWQVQ